MTIVAGDNDNDPELEVSPLSSILTRDGVALTVRIFRLAASSDPWCLKVVTCGGLSTTWEDTFATDSDAYRAFYLTLEHEGLIAFLESERARL